MPPVYTAQSEASYAFDEKLHDYLVCHAPNDREAQRLRRCARPHASGFITAVPSQEDGRECILKPRNFQVAVAYRLGVPVLKEEVSCPLCEQTIDVFGDHAACCTRSYDRIVRHNSLRNLLYRFASDGLLSPELEKQGILGSGAGRRPGDVTLALWSEGKGLAIDVAVTSPLQKASVRLLDPCEEYATARKHAKYDKDFKSAHYSFAAMVWESLGAINVEGEEILRQIFSFTAKKLHREFSSFCGRSWAHFSCCLQRSVSQAILLRTEGHEFRDSRPKALAPVEATPAGSTLVTVSTAALVPTVSLSVTSSHTTQTLVFSSSASPTPVTLSPLPVSLSAPVSRASAPVSLSLIHLLSSLLFLSLSHLHLSLSLSLRLHMLFTPLPPCVFHLALFLALQLRTRLHTRQRSPQAPHLRMSQRWLR
jgi:hypothetical protein